VRVRPPRDFGIRIGPDVAEAQLLLWKNTLKEVDRQKFNEDTVVMDFVKQDSKVTYAMISLG